MTLLTPNSRPEELKPPPDLTLTGMASRWERYEDKNGAERPAQVDVLCVDVQ